MRTLPSLLTLVLIAATCVAPCQTWNEYRSVLRPMESQLASLCYLFQGLPTGVYGLDFGYDTQEPSDCEKYLVKLLDAPKPYQIDLRESAVFLASRVYTDGKGKDYLLLSDHDALRFSLYYGDMKSFTIKDRLLRDAINCYMRLPRSRKDAQTIWLESEKGVNSVRGNVKKLLAKIIVTRTLGNDWLSPAAYR